MCWKLGKRPTETNNARKIRRRTLLAWMHPKRDHGSTGRVFLALKRLCRPYDWYRSCSYHLAHWTSLPLCSCWEIGLPHSKEPTTRPRGRRGPAGGGVLSCQEHD